ncbi:MAG: secretion protein [Stygiobacter sp. RIFOXYC12_FULL_38_8]|nr:MAG: secretion protein [Stygiobacter sp. GWC2_38_9]OGU83759.1 MAG: secretion protein [Stygiobacter sp. RIFOXYA12_FULL_38_9]OGV07725.1 MAG: secretion protein [Stygiobacter sp. RIFOXYB2_FULL_37_11]OGV12728.1 MAG: secretion protein [Stygiobacter sp. RIFOXYC2_FULL_38_25]OGV17673.1 MAG: secretion protein [Stygiobacter sp. RIFOXYA2_FULL_38_8]OGV26986.1 MAG: secretion protein [Stygiobacter sp. RIFOXYC12_FULL_38_8]OGV82015.1 MAG: secretion protein [Stygiobacter sp. GWF2_38_21]
MKTIFNKANLSVALITLILLGCGNGNGKYDATGTFESEEVIVSSEAMGKLVRFDVEEGAQLKQNQIVGVIDTLQLYLKKKQLEASVKAVLSKQPDVATQLAALQEQIKTAEIEKKRVENLVKSNAATTKQLDDVNAQLEVLNKQYNATKSSLTITKQGLQSETFPLQIQIEQINDQLSKSRIINPVDGVVLTRYTKQNEVTATGKALYKIADLSEMTLRAYVNGDQLGQIKLGQKVKVFVDKGESEQKEMSGEIYWVSSKAEFTPKTIQTKDERANLVYAIKVRVKNDGYLKIGMYGEVKF